MNTLDKLAEPTEQEYLAHAEQEELLLFASESDYLAIANGVWELFVKRAKVLQSCEPVGEIKIHMIGANDVCAIQWIGNYQPKVGDKLFTIPPAFFPKSEYNKLLDVLQELDRALCVIGVVGKIDGYDVIRRDSVIDIARDRLKKAEANLQN